MRAVITKTLAAAALASACAVAQAAPVFTITGGANVPDVGNDFTWIQNPIRESTIGAANGGGTTPVLGLSEAAYIRIEYMGKEAVFTNQFYWGTLGSTPGTLVTSTGPGAPNPVGNLTTPTSITQASVPQVLFVGAATARLPFYFLANVVGGSGNVVENGHTGTNITDDLAFWWTPNANGALGNQVYLLLDDGGGGLDNDHDDMIIRLTAEVPEPSTYMLLLAGLGLLGFAARRRMQG